MDMENQLIHENLVLNILKARTTKIHLNQLIELTKLTESNIIKALNRINKYTNFQTIRKDNYIDLVNTVLINAEYNSTLDKNTNQYKVLQVLIRNNRGLLLSEISTLTNFSESQCRNAIYNLSKNGYCIDHITVKKFINNKFSYNVKYKLIKEKPNNHIRIMNRQKIKHIPRKLLYIYLNTPNEILFESNDLRPIK